jgi:hypothetical protein
MDCQRNRPGEDVHPWVRFFLHCLVRMQGYLKNKLDMQAITSEPIARDRAIYLYINSHPGAQAGAIASSLGIPLPTVKKVLGELTSSKFITRRGMGKGTNYVVGQ